ncbi:ABC-type transport system periplasmic substrate-binding protein (probable substrate branched-chain amino acids) [Natronomonas pharaonis DSM 2160]|uniref:ABC-type transport system periplasmic substrate-binding protein (Probable substrate branched-chain amino acids) n=1 Tax=Natronomonas pharaonis (strain ATCC 35678 / DSM 2160 / CIP 103997 / JCM 8858 / NBRC 14720 / NCIMB 2260 / Gabara) TaxID=348780 RepID=A0A1U7ETE8_NATPD|nr:ABC transporter substrate-binding protein [Natronomonas pharaonis]CAI48178.1 ABC-type transport system periplasmic substrate-binding protein (probable substrate branched-chain amino acids) [Natronomonas pharaonis DSM 2160]
MTDSFNLDRRNVLKAAGGTAVAAALAGCSVLLDGEENGNGGAALEDVPDEPIEAGLQTFREGAPSVLGLQAEYGAQTAIRRINDAGGIAGRQMELDVIEEEGATIENYRRFVDEGKDVTFGPISSGGHEELVPVVEEEGVVNVGTDGTVTTLYETEYPDVEYSFRFQNHDVMEALSAARTAVEQLGAENIDTFANINPDYTFGYDEREVFNAGIEQLTGAEEVYDGYPELGADDMSTHVTAVADAEPDVLFTSCWGGDATLLLDQGQAGDLFDAVDITVGPVLYSAANDFSEELVEGNIWSGSRNFYWGSPPQNQWDPGVELFEEAQDEHDTIPTAHFMSGYGAVTAWATAVEKAVDIVGGWPSQDQIAATLENHGFYTPAGYHTIGPDHQGYSTAHFGEMTWDDGMDMPVLENVTTIPASHVSPPQGEISIDWIESW